MPYNSKKKRKEYIRQYINKRYHSDKDFHDKVVEGVKKSQRKNKKKWAKKNLCMRCGKMRDSKWKTCESCRKIGRRWYYKDGTN